MTGPNALHLFFLAALMLNLTPGNDMVYVASRTISGGTQAGLLSALGVFAGCFVHITAATLGLSIIIARSALLFEIVKYAGAAYLVYLGVSSLVRKVRIDEEVRTVPPARAFQYFRHG